MGEGYYLIFTEWRHYVSQNEVWGRGSYITLFSPSDVTAFHRIIGRLGLFFTPFEDQTAQVTIPTRSADRSVSRKTLTQRWLIVGPASNTTLSQHCVYIMCFHKKVASFHIFSILILFQLQLNEKRNQTMQQLNSQISPLFFRQIFYKGPFLA